MECPQLLITSAAAVAVFWLFTYRLLVVFPSRSFRPRSAFSQVFVWFLISLGRHGTGSESDPDDCLFAPLSTVHTGMKNGTGAFYFLDLFTFHTHFINIYRCLMRRMTRCLPRNEAFPVVDFGWDFLRVKYLFNIKHQQTLISWN